MAVDAPPGSVLTPDQTSVTMRGAGCFVRMRGERDISTEVAPRSNGTPDR
jgi:hypothetical protein